MADCSQVVLLFARYKIGAVDVGGLDSCPECWSSDTRLKNKIGKNWGMYCVNPVVLTTVPMIDV